MFYFYILLYFCIHITPTVYSMEPTQKTFDYGVAQIQGKRSTMEDTYSLHTSGPLTMAGIFDGHNGEEVSSFLKKNLLEKIATNYKNNPNTDITIHIQNACLEINKTLKEENCKSGSTAVVVCELDGTLYCSNIGDSRIIGSDGNALTQDHTPKNESELKRIGKHLVFKNRIIGRLAVSRAFGDFYFENFGVIAEPEITSIPLSNLEFVVLVSDGISDVIGNQDVARFVHECLKRNNSLDTIAKKLVTVAAQQSVKLWKDSHKDKIENTRIHTLPDTFSLDEKDFPSLLNAHDNMTAVIMRWNS